MEKWLWNFTFSGLSACAKYLTLCLTFLQYKSLLRSSSSPQDSRIEKTLTPHHQKKWMSSLELRSLLYLEATKVLLWKALMPKIKKWTNYSIIPSCLIFSDFNLSCTFKEHYWTDLISFYPPYQMVDHFLIISHYKLVLSRCSISMLHYIDKTGLYTRSGFWHF